MILKQFDLRFNRNTYTIEKDGLKLISKSLSGRTEDFIDFQSIGKQITRERKRSLIPLFLSILFFAYGLLIFIGKQNGGDYGMLDWWMFTGSLMFFLIFYFMGKKYLYLKSDISYIRFLDNNPSKKKLMAFIDELHHVQKQRLLELYATYDEELTLEDYKNNLRWLKEKQLITKEESQDLLQEIIKQGNATSNRPIGFRKETIE